MAVAMVSGCWVVSSYNRPIMNGGGIAGRDGDFKLMVAAVIARVVLEHLIYPLAMPLELTMDKY